MFSVIKIKVEFYIWVSVEFVVGNVECKVIYIARERFGKKFIISV